MSDSTGMFVCNGCDRQFRWKPELAGKRVKCKCGVSIQVPTNSRGQVEEDDAYELEFGELPTTQPAPEVERIIQRPPVKQKRGGVGRAFLGIPPLIGFWMAAIGITFVLGGVIFFLAPIILIRINLAPPSVMYALRPYMQTVVLLMAIGPFLCMAAPTDWKARVLAFIVSDMVIYLWSTSLLTISTRRGATGILLVFLLLLPLLFFMYIAQLGKCFGSTALAGGAFVLSFCVYGVFGLIYWGSTIRWGPGDEWLMYLIGYSMLGLIIVLLLAAIRVISTVISAALTARTRQVS